MDAKNVLVSIAANEQQKQLINRALSGLCEVSFLEDFRIEKVP